MQKLSQSIHDNTAEHRKLGRDAREQFPAIEDLPRRVREYATLRGLGYSFRQIGRAYNVTAQAVAIMLARHRQGIALGGDIEAAACLSSRATNVLGRLGIATPSQAGGLDLEKLLRSQRNCGQKTVDEIRRWAGVRGESNASVD